jgi:uncharacterized membrane protein YdbT with pleckstrin-like domain
MITILAFATLAVVLIIVLVVAYHLIGIFVSLKRGANHLEALAGGLIATRDNTIPLNGRVDEINAGLTGLVEPLLATNSNLGTIVKITSGRS